MLEQPQRQISPAFVNFGPVFTALQARSIIDTHGDHLIDPPQGLQAEDPGWKTNKPARGPVRWSRDNAWIFRTFKDIVGRVRLHAYPFSYAGFAEPLSLMCFRGEDRAGLGWQMDTGAGASCSRKLTLVCELSDPKDYVGGELEVYGADGVRAAVNRPLGSFVCYPSYAVSRVKTVSQGTRWALVGYLTGPAFV